jgi:hypothetical protein
MVAAQSLMRVAADVDKSTITIGDRITYSLTIEHKKNLKIEKPGPGANLGQFEIKDYKIAEPVQQGDLITEKFEYVISVFDTGHFVIPPFPVAFSSSDTTRKYQLIYSDPIDIYVKSVLNSENAEIKDIKPPQTVPFNYRKWIWYGIAGLLIIVAVILTIYIIRKRRKGEPLFRKEVIRPAHEIALEELEKLKARFGQMLKEGKHKILFTELSEILRVYLENRFFIDATEETTGEIENSISEIDMDEEAKFKAVQVLEFSDLVKFAKYIPNRNEAEKNLAELEAFIEETKLVFTPVEQKVEISGDGNEPVPVEDTANVEKEQGELTEGNPKQEK